MKKLKLILIVVFIVLNKNLYAQDCTITGPVAITTVCTGGVPTISVSASGGTGGFTYLWYSNTSAINTGGSPIPTETSPGFNPSAAVAGTFYYYCVVTGTGCGPNPSTVAIVTVAADPVITSEPASPAAICSGGSTTAISISASGGTPSLVYQWQYKNSGTWENVIAGVPAGATYTGSTGTSFTVGGITSAGAYEYQCVVSSAGDGCGTATSSVVTVNVAGDPVITSEPASPASICSGGSTTAISISASGGTPSLVYQWQYKNSGTWENVTDGVPAGATYTGSTGTSFVVGGITSAGAYEYQCVVSSAGDGCGTATSSVVTVNVAGDPVITSEPASPAAICSGSSSSAISISASGGTPSLVYQWQYKNSGTWENVTAGVPAGATYTGSTGTSFVVGGITSAGAYEYQCVVSSAGSGCGITTSSSVTVNVVAPPSITADPVSPPAICSEATTAAMTITATGGTPQWQYNNSGTWQNVSDGTPSGSIYSGATGTSFIVSGIVSAGSYQYRCQVISALCPAATSSTVNVVVNSSATINSQPSSPAAICSGGTTAAITIGASGTSISYQWQFNNSGTWANVSAGVPAGSTYTGATGSSFVVGGITAAGSYDYRCIITGACGSMTSNMVTVMVKAYPDILSMAENVGNGTPFSFVPINGTNGIVPSGTIYSWIVSADANISGEANGTDQTSIWGTLSHSKSGVKTATYTVTPKNGTCAGSTFTIVVSVYPKPIITNKATTICSGSSFNATPVDGLVDVVPSGTTYTWPLPAAAGISGLSSGTNSASLSGSLTNTTTSPVTVTYVVTPKSGSQPGDPFNVAVTVNPLPLPVITGSATVCYGSTENYSTEAGKSGYIWSVSGGTIVSGLGTESISVLWNAPGAGYVRVNYTHFGCTATTPTEKIIAIRPQITLTGAYQAATVCSGQSATINLSGLQPLSIPVIDYTINGIVQSPATGVVSDGSGNSTFTTGTLVPSNNGKILRITKITTGTAPVCFTNFAIETPPLIVNTASTPVITGNASPCINSTGNVYTTEAGMTDYNWVVSAGGSITAGGGTGDNTVTVTWNTSGAHSVSASYTNSGGCTSPAPTVKLINVNPLPVPVINGAATVCAGSTGNVYTTDPGMLSYSWNVTGGTITSGGTGNMIIVTWNTTGTVKVNYTDANNCTAVTETIKNVTVNPLPVISLTGNISVCDGTTNVYTTNAGMNNYVWEVSTGGSVISGGTLTDNSISVKWSSAGSRTIRVNYTDPSTSCTAASSKIINVTVNSLPAPSISGPSSVLVGSAGNNYITESGMTGYDWIVSSGGLITSALGTNQITVTWNTGGTKTITLNYINSNSCTAVIPSVKNVSVNSLPAAGGFSISGTPRVGFTLTAVYSYSDSEGDAEGGTTVNWFRDTDGSGTTWNSITGPLTSKTYVLTNSDFGKKIRFELVPVAVSGALTGLTYTSSSTAIIDNPAPVASSVTIIGSKNVGDAITGQYSYQDAEGDIENGSLYKWYSGPSGGPFTAIPGETSITHVIKANEQGLYFRFEITPYSSGGTLIGATKTSASFGPANSKPYATGVSVTGTAEVLGTLSGFYTFHDIDPADHEGASIYRWLRDGTVIPAASAITYTLTAEDEGSVIAFEVIPVSSTGYPDAGDPVRSSSTTAIIDPSLDVPQALEVCIEGIWSAGQRITGKYFYDFVKSEGTSVYQWYRNNIAIPGATSISYVLTSSDITSRADITFSVTPKSSNKPAKTGLQVTSPPLSIIQIPKDEFSVAEAAVTLTTNDPRIEGSYAGPGISGNKFSPLAAGTLGSPHTLVYFVNIVNSHHNCSQQSSRQVSVTTTAAYFEGIDPVYCQNKGQDVITVRNAPPQAELTSWDFTCTDNDAIIYKVDYPNVTIDTRKLRPKRGVDKLRFTYTRFGSTYQLEQPLTVDSVGTAIKIINLDPEYCKDSPRKYVSVEGIYPLGGSADWNGYLLSDTIVASAYINPSKGTAGSSYPITYQYISPDGCRSAKILKSASINPLPVTSFQMNPNCNIEGGPVTLAPDQPGGLFSGDGVSGSIGLQKLYPDIADLGPHTITYSIRDAKGCDDTLSKITTVRRALGTFADIPDAICYRDTTYIVKVNNLPASDLVISSFTNTKGTLVYSLPDAKASYSVIAAGAGDDELVFSYKWYGVDFSIKKKVFVDKLNPATIGGISSGDTICTGQGTRQLYPLPEGGAFSGPVTGSSLDPSLAVIGVTNYSVSYKYVNARTLCSTSTTIPIRIFPAPKVAFKAADLCIDDDSDPAQFLNKTTSSDPVASWNWSFTEAGNTASSTAQNASYLFRTGGLLGVSLSATTINGCIVKKDTTFDMARKPVADFYVKRDCFKPGELLLLRDTSKVYTAVAKAWEWKVNGIVTGNAKNSVFLKTDTGYIRVSYTVKTDPKYLNCNSTVVKDVYIRPTITLQKDGYFEDFERGKNGWTKTDALNIWSFGKPDGTDIKTAASGNKAWFTKDVKKGSAEIESPCFDFSALQRPVIDLDISRFFEKERDGVALQYTVGDNGIWKYIGTIDDGIEWYNSATIRGLPGGGQLGWTTLGSPETEWSAAYHSLDELKGKKDVKFRIAYGSEGKFVNHDGFAFDNIRIGERSRNVLMEHFTNMTDMASNQIKPLVDTIAARKKSDVINIQYHTGFPASDPFFDANPGETNARIVFYGLTKVPYTFIDGGTTVDHSMVFDNVISKLDSNEVTKRALVNSKFRLSIEPVISGSSLSVKGEIVALENMDKLKDLTLFLVVTEKKNSNYAGATGGGVFLNVFRKFIPDAGGIIINHSQAWTKGERVPIEEKTWLITRVLNTADIEIVAFLQNAVTKEVYQAFSVIKPDIIVGINDFVPKAAGFSLYPNPAHDRIYIEFGEPLKSNAEIRIYSYSGELVKTMTAGSGLTEFKINDPGLKGGIYMVRISMGIFDLGYRKLVIIGE